MLRVMDQVRLGRYRLVQVVLFPSPSHILFSGDLVKRLGATWYCGVETEATGGPLWELWMMSRGLVKAVGG